jgi:hypothetical protein
MLKPELFRIAIDTSGAPAGSSLAEQSACTRMGTREGE